MSVDAVEVERVVIVAFKPLEIILVLNFDHISDIRLVALQLQCTTTQLLLHCVSKKGPRLNSL